MGAVLGEVGSDVLMGSSIYTGKLHFSLVYNFCSMWIDLGNIG